MFFEKYIYKMLNLVFIVYLVLQNVEPYSFEMLV